MKEGRWWKDDSTWLQIKDRRQRERVKDNLQKLNCNLIQFLIVDIARNIALISSHNRPFDMSYQLIDVLLSYIRTRNAISICLKDMFLLVID